MCVFQKEAFAESQMICGFPKVFQNLNANLRKDTFPWSVLSVTLSEAWKWKVVCGFAAIDGAGILPQQVPHVHRGQKPPFADTGTLSGIFVLLSQAVSQPPATWALSTVVLFLVIKWVFFLLEWAWRYPENEARCMFAKFQKASRQMKPLRLSCEFPLEENATADTNSGGQTILPEGDKQPPSPCRPLPLLSDWAKGHRASAAPAARDRQTHSSKGALEQLMLISIESCAAFPCGAGGREALSLSRTVDQEQALNSLFVPVRTSTKSHVLCRGCS